MGDAKVAVSNPTVAGTPLPPTELTRRRLSERFAALSHEMGRVWNDTPYRLIPELVDVIICYLISRPKLLLLSFPRPPSNWSLAVQERHIRDWTDPTVEFLWAWNQSIGFRESRLQMCALQLTEEHSHSAATGGTRATANTSGSSLLTTELGDWLRVVSPAVGGRGKPQYTPPHLRIVQSTLATLPLPLPRADEIIKMDKLTPFLSVNEHWTQPPVTDPVDGLSCGPLDADAAAGANAFIASLHAAGSLAIAEPLSARITKSDDFSHSLELDDES